MLHLSDPLIVCSFLLVFMSHTVRWGIEHANVNKIFLKTSAPKSNHCYVHHQQAVAADMDSFVMGCRLGSHHYLIMANDWEKPLLGRESILDREPAWSHIHKLWKGPQASNWNTV